MIKEAAKELEAGVFRPIKNYYTAKDANGNTIYGAGLKFRYFNGLPATAPLVKLFGDTHVTDGIFNMAAVIDEIGPNAVVDAFASLADAERIVMMNHLIHNRVKAELAKFNAHKIITPMLPGVSMDAPVWLRNTLGIVPSNALDASRTIMDLNNPHVAPMYHLLKDGMAIYQMMADFVVNSSTGVIEFDKLFYGDPAAFKDNKDKIKRAAGPNSTGTKLRTFTTEDTNVYPMWMKTELEKFYREVNANNNDYLAVEVGEVQEGRTEEEIAKLIGEGYEQQVKN